MKEYRVETALEATGASRALVCVEGKNPLVVAPPPEFGGPPGIWTPEDLLVSAVESCLLMTFFHLARERGLHVQSYRSRAVGVLVKDTTGLRFSRIEVYPEVIVQGGQELVAATREVLQRAQALCLVSRSLEANVLVYPFIEATLVPATVGPN